MNDASAVAEKVPAMGEVAASGARHGGFSTRFYLIALSLLLTLPVLAIAGYLTYRYVESEHQGFELQARHLASQGVLAIENEIRGITTATELLAEAQALADGNLAEFHQRALAIATRESVNVTLRDRNSRQLVNSGVAWGQPLPDRSRLVDYDREVLRTGKPVVSDFFVGIVDQAPSAAVVVPVRRNGEIVYLLSWSFKTERLRQRFEKLFPEGWRGSVVDRTGVLIIRSDDPQSTGQRAIAPFVEAARAGETIWRGTGRDGSDTLGGIGRTDFGWFIGAGGPYAIFGAELNRTLAMIGLAAAALLLAALAGAVAMARRISGPLSQLMGGANKLGRGASFAYSPGENREVNAVAQALAGASVELQRSQEALRRQADEWKVILETVPAGVWFTRDAAAAHIESTASGARMIPMEGGANPSLTAPDGKRPTHVTLYRGGAEVTEPQTLPMQRAARGENVDNEELELRYRNGATQFLLFNAAPLRDSAGALTGAVGAAIDITDRKRAEALALEQAKILELVVSGAKQDECLAAITAALGRLRPGLRAEILLGHTEPAGACHAMPITAAGQRFGSLLLYLDEPRAATAWETQIAATGAHLAGVTIERRRAMRALRESENQLRLIADAMPALITYIGADEHYRFNNKTYEQWFGYSRGEIEGKPVRAVMGEAAYAVVKPHVDAVLAGKQVSFAARVPYRDGKTRDVEATYVPARDATGAISGFYAFVNDISERTRFEQALKQAAADADKAAAERALILSQLAEGVIVTDPQGNIVFVNQAAARIHGVSRLDVPPDDYSSAYHLFTEDGRPYPPHDLPLARAVMKDQVVLDETWRIKRADGSEVVAVGSASPVRTAQGEKIGAVLTLRDETKRHDAMKALEESDLRQNLALSAGQMGVWDWNVAGQRLLWNEAQFALYGVTPKSFTPSYENFMEFVVADDRDRMLRDSAAALEGGNYFDAEFRINRADGAMRWIMVRSKAIRNEAGAVIRIVGVNLDITERKAADEQRMLLIHELNHRVKNTLATIQSIAVQTLRGGKVEAEARQAFEARLFTLARAHDILTRENWSGADLKDIAERALAPFEGEPERIDIQGGKLRLSAKPALALAMALHELATNAAKYGALARPTGRIGLAWTVKKVKGEKRLTLTWKETGGPPVKPPERKGFGSRLIERGLAAEFDGTVTMDYRKTGLVCTLEAPLPPASSGGDAFVPY